MTKIEPDNKEADNKEAEDKKKKKPGFLKSLKPKKINYRHYFGGPCPDTYFPATRDRAIHDLLLRTIPKGNI